MERAGEWSPNGPENRGVRKDRGSIPQRSANSYLFRHFNCAISCPMTWFDWFLIGLCLYMLAIKWSVEKAREEEEI